MSRVPDVLDRTVITIEGYSEREWERVGGWGPMPKEFSRAANKEGLTQLVFEGKRLVPSKDIAPKM